MAVVIVSATLATTAIHRWSDCIRINGFQHASGIRDGQVAVTMTKARPHCPPVGVLADHLGRISGPVTSRKNVRADLRDEDWRASVQGARVVPARLAPARARTATHGT